MSFKFRPSTRTPKMPPRNWEEYIKQLREKPVGNMSLEELKDYLDYVIENKLRNHTYDNPILEDVYEHLQIYFRLVDLQTNILAGRVDANRALLQALLLFIKKESPMDVKRILEAAEELGRERDMNSLDGLPLETQNHVLDEVDRLLREREAMRKARDKTKQEEK